MNTQNLDIFTTASDGQFFAEVFIRGHDDAPIHTTEFCATEADAEFEARAWIAAQEAAR